MDFRELPVSEALGGLLAHSIKLESRALKKGHQLLADDLDALTEAGVLHIVIAMLTETDVHEDEAALHIARCLAAEQPAVSLSAPFTGRCNLVSQTSGVLTIERSVIDEINAVDESVTVATLAENSVVTHRQMIATVKVIPFAVDQSVLDRCSELANKPAVVEVHPFTAKRATLIQTQLAQTADRILDKTERVTNDRLVPLKISIDRYDRCAHSVQSLKPALVEAANDRADLVLIAGASAIVDRRDVIPAAIEQAGGRVIHFGMPVDPGNLILLGELNGKTVLGLPGCARSPKYNGLDMILERYAADLPVTPRVLQAMGVGGLLKEIASRPQPRAGRRDNARVSDGRSALPSALVLAAGQSRRMGAVNKLLALVGGEPMLLRTIRSVLASTVGNCVLVTGHDSAAIVDVVNATFADAISEGRLQLAHNPDYSDGLSTSLRTGLAQIDEHSDSVLVCLGDMPAVQPIDIDRLIAAFSVDDDRLICVPTWQGKRGNPVLWARQFVDSMSETRGDVGARHLIGDNEHVVREVVMQDDAVLTDIDTPDALSGFNQRALPPKGPNRAN